MTIDPKHLLAIILLVGGFSLALLVTLVWRRAKDVALFVLVFGSVLVEKVNVTFLGVEWYRGTSRGIEISALDFAPLCLLIAPLLVAASMSQWSKALRWFAGVSWLMAAGAEVLTLSRLGVPVFAVVSAGTALACTSWRLTRRKLAVMAVVTVVVSGFLELSWDGLKARYEQGNIREELTGRHGVETRGEYWRLAWRMAREHPAGVGLNNWSYYVSKTYGHELGYAYRDYDEFDTAPATWEMYFAPAADSLPALALGELGFVGAALLLAMWLRWFQMGAGFLTSRLDEDPLRRVPIGLFFGAVGIFFQSATEWTYKQTAVMFTFHVLMGALASVYSLRRASVIARKKASPPPATALEILPERVAPAASG